MNSLTLARDIDALARPMLLPQEFMVQATDLFASQVAA
jgi:hypothetical protein